VRQSSAVRTAPQSVRQGVPADAERLYALIHRHRDEGHLLPRDLDEIRRRAGRFVVAERDGVLNGCAELAPLSAAVAEVRSLVVTRDARGTGVAARLLEELRRRAREGGYQTLTAFTHDPGFFIHHRFSMVPHQWIPEKIARDCAGCALFRRCGQHAMMLLLTMNRESPHDGAGDIEHEGCRAAVA
jgi:N-acetylglutamate synthase-like GNAT family acetyltransferase